MYGTPVVFLNYFGLPSFKGEEPWHRPQACSQILHKNQETFKTSVSVHDPLKPCPSHLMSLIFTVVGTDSFPGLVSEAGLSLVSLLLPQIDLLL